MDKIATMTWPSAEAQAIPGIDAVRIPYIEGELLAGNTNTNITTVSSTVTQRLWSNQASADAWAAFITDAATNNGTSVDVVITDNVAP